MKVIQSASAPAALGPYSQAVVDGGTIYVSGQLGIDPDTGELSAQDIVAQTEQALKNIEAIVLAAGSGPAKLLKLTVYLTDISDFARANEVMARALREPYPARACVEVSALPKSARIEIDAIATLPVE